MKLTVMHLQLLVLLSALLTCIAIPIPEQGTENKSVGQHLGKASLSVFGGLSLLGLMIGSVTYGFNWWHRFKSMHAEQEGNMTIWRAEQAQKEQEHQNKMEALTMILDIARNYTENLGKETTGFDPFAIAKDMEADAQISADQIVGDIK